MTEKAFQDFYPDEWSLCYGCGRLNEQGLQIKSYWDGDETVCTFTPRPYHTAVPGAVYGGLIASLIDCHSTGSAAAAAYRAQGRPMDSDPPLRFVTASLHVDYLRPTPIEGPIELRSRIVEVKGRKVVIATDLSVKGQVCARGEVVAVQIPDHFAMGDDLLDHRASVGSPSTLRDSRGQSLLPHSHSRGTREPTATSHPGGWILTENTKKEGSHGV